ncbi:MAG: glycoside hydrolase family 2 protein [Armatimonadota bacterium]
MKFRKEQQGIDLNGRWAFAFDNKDYEFSTIADIETSGLTVYPCSVPGNFELDLQANGIIEDPFFGMNISKLTKYENTHIWYFCRFDADEGNLYESDLYFEGLDCIADVFLNRQKIGSCDNMLIEQVINTTGLLKPMNELVVHIKPAVEEARKYQYPPLVQAGAGGFESLYVRKAPHMYGWDIMPRAVSAGIWKPVSIRYHESERLKSAFIETQHISADHKFAALILYYDAQISGPISDRYEIAVEGRCGESIFSSQSRMLFNAGRIHIHIGNPRLWWSKGRGDANLYDVKVCILKDGIEIDQLDFVHGIRKIELKRTSLTDARGTGEFCFIVNGEKVFVLGTNWVPADAYHSRDISRIPAMLDLVDDIGCNMIRCWGGNVYENDAFYDICDRKGIMIWQDFAMACAIYPQDDEFRGRFAAEVGAVVRRLRQHPSIVLWSGDNECDYVWNALGQDPNKNTLTRDTIPAVLKQEDWTRPYLPSSPYIDAAAYKAGSVGISEDHLWGPRDYFKGDFYKSPIAHFASEIGYHGCPSPESIRKFISPEKVWPYTDNDEWLLHATSPIPGVDMYDYRVGLMEKQVRELFGTVPDNLDDYSFASQVSQAEAKKYFIEMFRSTKWRRTGIIWWNIIDGWPQFSDAVVDYYFDRKLAYDAIKRAQAPIHLVMKEPQGWNQELIVCNDTRDDVEVVYRITDAETDEVMAEGTALSYADSVTLINHIPYASSWRRFYILSWKARGVEGRSHYLAGNPPFELDNLRRWLGKAYNGI